MDRWRIHKFGGSSLADAACLRQVAGILEAEASPRLAVVLSACAGVTDGLLAMLAASERQDAQAAAQLNAIHQRHATVARTLLDPPSAETYIEQLDADCHDIRGILHAVRLTRSSSGPVRDVVAGFGEIWSTRLFARYFGGATRRPGAVHWLDAREVIEVEWRPLGPTVRWAESRARAARVVPRDPAATLVVTGFIARDAQGLQTTLGRNGSDFSASIMGDLLDADEIHIWTDVDGVMSADPRRVPDATIIDSLSYQEAMELAYFGAKVIHPQTMAPAVLKGIPIWIRNTFAPERPGTLIGASPVSSQPIKGITSIDRTALVNVEGAGMIGVPGTAQRLFGALREHGISVILISQGGSEHSICFAVPQAQADRTERIVRETFDAELRLGQIQNVDVVPACSILSVVGDGMAGMPGIAAKVFGALGAAAVNVRAIAQGSSERNISLVVDEHHATRGLRAVHSSFYLSPHTVSIGLIGPGVVGSALLNQLASQIPRLQREFRLDLRLRAIASSRHLLLGDPALDATDWRVRLPESAAADLQRFEEHVQADHLPHAVIIDCTASAEVSKLYPRWLARGIHVVTPNKKANSGPGALHADVQQARRAGGTHYLYEATVGAGLPIIQTLRDLRQTGDEIRRIEGLLSGTLSYLFNAWDGSRPFSAIVRDAKGLGYTEPDPRDDLSGMDVARKLIILAREMGLTLELSNVELEGLVPPTLASCSPAEFLDRLPELDDAMLARYEAARNDGRFLRYVAALDATANRATVGLVGVEPSHPFANINLTDNVVRFVTSRYDPSPLVVQGPGAGPDVTAAAVFADLLRVCAYLGAKL